MLEVIGKPAFSCFAGVVAYGFSSYFCSCFRSRASLLIESCCSLAMSDTWLVLLLIEDIALLAVVLSPAAAFESLGSSNLLSACFGATELYLT